MASKRMPAALSVLKTRNFSKMFLRARRLLEFSHGLGHERRFRDLRGTSAYPPRLAVKADIPDRQVRAKSCRGQSQQGSAYSMTSSARAESGHDWAIYEYTP
jgi:hypothetical protein